MNLKPVLLIRGGSEPRDEMAFEQLGIAYVSEPFTRISSGSLDEAERLVKSLEVPDSWLIATSRNAMEYWSSLLPSGALREAISASRTLKFAAIGEGSKASLLALGADYVHVGAEPDSQGLLSLLSVEKPATALIPGGNLAHTALPEGLKKLGWSVVAGIVYLNGPVKETPKVLVDLAAGKFSYVVVRSPSAVRALNQFFPRCEVPLICGGRLTLAQAEELMLPIATYSEDPSPEGIAALVKNYQESESR